MVCCSQEIFRAAVVGNPSARAGMSEAPAPMRLPCGRSHCCWEQAIGRASESLAVARIFSPHGAPFVTGRRPGQSTTLRKDAPPGSLSALVAPVVREEFLTSVQRVISAAGFARAPRKDARGASWGNSDAVVGRAKQRGSRDSVSETKELLRRARTGFAGLREWASRWRGKRRYGRAIHAGVLRLSPNGTHVRTPFRFR